MTDTLPARERLSIDAQRYAGSTLAQAAEYYVEVVDACAMARALLAGMPPDSEHRPLAWDKLQRAEEMESDVRRALQRAVYQWRRHGEGKP